MALAALGFLLMYKATGVISFAHGDMITLGTYLAIWLIQDSHGASRTCSGTSAPSA